MSRTVRPTSDVPVRSSKVALPALGVLVVSLGVYRATLLPGLGFWDTAEFQALGPVLGIAHPTGYPTYTLLLWLASVVLQPIGDAALRANLLSALLVSGAAALCSVVVVLLTRRPLLGAAGGLLLAVTVIAWRDALRADPHALHLFLAALLLVLLVEWGRRERRHDERAGRWLVAASVTFGLALGNHALTLMLAPGVGVYVLAVEPRILWRRWRLVAACAAVVAATTIVVYAYIPLRAAMEPPLDYARPTTWERFRYLVLGEQFQGTFRQPPALADAISTVWAVLWANLGVVAPLAALGAILGCVRHWRVVVLLGFWFVLTFTFSLGYLNADIERYYLVPLLAACVWAVLALDVLWDAAVGVLRRMSAPQAAASGGARPPGPAGDPVGAGPGVTQADLGEDPPGPRSPRRAALRVLLGAAAATVLLVPVLAPVPDRWRALDASRDRSASRWVDAVLAALPPEAVVVSWWSMSTPLWYARWVEGRRPDVTIIDDRDIVDEGLRNVAGAIDLHLGERPVYVIRLSRDLPALEEAYVLERVEGIPAPSDLHRVVSRRGAG